MKYDICNKTQMFFALQCNLDAIRRVSLGQIRDKIKEGRLETGRSDEIPREMSPVLIR